MCYALPFVYLFKKISLISKNGSTTHKNEGLAQMVRPSPGKAQVVLGQAVSSEVPAQPRFKRAMLARHDTFDTSTRWEGSIDSPISGLLI